MKTKEETNKEETIYNCIVTGDFRASLKGGSRNKEIDKELKKEGFNLECEEAALFILKNGNQKRREHVYKIVFSEGLWSPFNRR